MTDKLGVAGLTPAGPFPGKPTLYWRTQCIRCATVADYRLEYVLDQNSVGIPTCRVCFWIKWAEGDSRGVAVPDEEIRRLADENDYDIQTFVLPSTAANQPVVLECRVCGKWKVSRVFDIGWGCECSRAKRRAEERVAAEAKRRARRGYVPAPPIEGVAKPFGQSGLPAVVWWDHERNAEPLFTALFPSAKKSVHWIGPTCGHRFERPVATMATEAICLTCGADS